MPTCTQANSYLIPTRTLTNSYLLPTHTQTISYPIPTRTQANKCGIAPLKDEDGLTYSEPAAKAEILNKQFSSVFTCDDLSHKLLDKGPSTYDPMGRITVTTNGVYKLLAGIKIHKVTGPDGILGQLLKELASELAPI